MWCVLCGEYCSRTAHPGHRQKPCHRTHKLWADPHPLPPGLSYVPQRALFSPDTTRCAKQEERVFCLFFRAPQTAREKMDLFGLRPIGACFVGEGERGIRNRNPALRALRSSLALYPPAPFPPKTQMGERGIRSRHHERPAPLLPPQSRHRSGDLDPFPVVRWGKEGQGGG